MWFWNLVAEFPPPSLQIFTNLQLANCSNHADLMKSACRIPQPTPLLQILSNLLLTADFLKSACRIPPNFLKSPTLCRFAEMADLVDFPKSSNGQLPTCACRNFPPHLQIFSNLPLDSYLHVLVLSLFGLFILQFYYCVAVCTSHNGQLLWIILHGDIMWTLENSTRDIMSSSE